MKVNTTSLPALTVSVSLSNCRAMPATLISSAAAAAWAVAGSAVGSGAVVAVGAGAAVVAGAGTAVAVAAGAVVAVAAGARVASCGGGYSSSSPPPHATAKAGVAASILAIKMCACFTVPPQKVICQCIYIVIIITMYSLCVKKELASASYLDYDGPGLDYDNPGR